MRTARATLASIASQLIGFPHRIEQGDASIALHIDGPADYAQGHEIAYALSTPSAPLRCAFGHYLHGDDLVGTAFTFVTPDSPDGEHRLAGYLDQAGRQLRYVVYPATRSYAQRRFDDSPTGPDHCFGGGYAVMRFETGRRGSVVGWGITPTSAYRQAITDAGRASFVISSLPDEIDDIVRELAA